MAAGLGFKTFTTGEVLTAADVNGYLMQGILVFATEAARNSAITSPQEGQFAFTKDTNSLWYYTGSAWVASGATGDIEGVTAGTGISGGGTSGTVTITNSMATAIDAKGDLVVGTGADAFSRLAVGANNTVLTADSAEATGLKWVAATGAGLVLITNQSFTTSSAINVNSVFTSTYRNYRVIVNVTASSAQAGLPMRLRASGTDNSNANYIYAGVQNFSNDAVTYTVNENAGTSFLGGLQTNSTNGASTWEYEIRNPQASIYTAVNMRFTGSDGSRGSGLVQIVGYFKDTNSFDGFSLNPSSGNMTGRVYVYAYAE